MYLNQGNSILTQISTAQIGILSKNEYWKKNEKEKDGKKMH